MSRKGWTAVLGGIVAALGIARAVVYFTASDDHPSSYSSVSFSPTGGPPDDGGPPSGAVTGLPSLDPAAIPSDIPSEAPTLASLGPVQYEVTGNGHGRVCGGRTPSSSSAAAST